MYVLHPPMQDYTADQWSVSERGLIMYNGTFDECCQYIKERYQGERSTLRQQMNDVLK